MGEEMKIQSIPKEMLDKINHQAEAEYPKECCGMICGPLERKEIFSRVRPCENAQDRYHALDPENFPRTSKTAYFMDPAELLKIQRELRERKEEIRVIYHSHIDAGAYFSEEDTRIAMAEGEPAYPGVDYLVVSVMQGKVQDRNMFHWDRQLRKFIS